MNDNVRIYSVRILKSTQQQCIELVRIYIYVYERRRRRIVGSKREGERLERATHTADRIDGKENDFSLVFFQLSKLAQITSRTE